MINLYIDSYKDKNEIRNKEIRSSLEKNISNCLIDCIYNISSNHIDNTKVINININRPKFNDFINCIRNNSGDSDINIIANSDIYFDEKYIAKIADNIKPGEAYCISRHDLIKNKRVLFCRHDSQDAWIVKGKISNIDAPFFLGIRGCDNAFAKILSTKYKVINAAFNIQINHIHESGIRNYGISVVRHAYQNVPLTSFNNDIIFITSVNPFSRLKEQLRALRTWQGIIISVNTEKEILALEIDMPNLHFVRAYNDDITDGKYIKLSKIIKTLKNTDFKKYVIINSDIRIIDFNLFKQKINRDNPVLGVRHDESASVSPFVHGYDVFVLNKPQLYTLSGHDFAIGLPWWDFYVPMMLIKAKYRVDVIRGVGLFRHEYHETRYNYAKWVEYGQKFKRLYISPSRAVSLPDFCTETKQFIDKSINEIA